MLCMGIQLVFSMCMVSYFDIKCISHPLYNRGLYMSCSDNVVCALCGALNCTSSINSNVKTIFCWLAFILHFSQPAGDVICLIPNNPANKKAQPEPNMGT